MGLLHTTIIVTLFCTSFSAPQEPEIKEQLQVTDLVTEQPVPQPSAPSEPSEQPEQPETKPVNLIEEIVVVTEDRNDTRLIALPEESFTFRVYKFISDPIIRVVNEPKVNQILRNIGTCVVNGAMELFSYYLPAPFMPLLATAAGLVIPFEPVVMLKQRMPVTSYRRAFQTAMNSFLGTFDKYKVEEDLDPYMTRRFNRRLMNVDRAKKHVKAENVEDK